MTTTAPVDWWHYRCNVPIGTDPQPKTPEWNERERIILAYLYLTKRVVSKMLKSMPAHVERDDLESFANIGLMKAVQRYNHSLNVPFEAYATQSMRSAIMDGIRDNDWAPRSLRKAQRTIDKTEGTLKQSLGREPTTQEIAEALQLAPKDVSATKYRAEISTHAYIDASAEALNKSAEVVDDIDLIETMRHTLAITLKSLPIKEAAIIAMKYYEDKNLSDIAKIMGISEVKVGALHADAVLSLWQALESLLTD